jgi:hypothetical protein
MSKAKAKIFGRNQNKMQGIESEIGSAELEK